MDYLMKNYIISIKKFLLVFIVSLLALISLNIKQIHGEDVTYIEAPWVYKIENNVVAIIGYVGSDEECVIPWTLGGLEVKVVRKIKNDNLKKINIPNNDVEVSSEITDNFEVSYYTINEEGQNEIVDSNKSESSNPIANFFSNLFGSKDKKEKQNNDATTNNNDNTVSENNNTQTTDNNTIGDPFDIANSNTDSNTTSTNNTTQVDTNNTESKDSSTALIVIIVLVVVAAIVYFLFKNKDGVATSRYIREFKRKIRRFFNKFK